MDKQRMGEPMKEGAHPASRPHALKDADVDRALTVHGGPAGAELDALWVTIANNIALDAAASKPVHSDGLAPRWWRLLSAGVPALGALALFVVLSSAQPADDAAFAVRGHHQSDAVITIDCGALDAPCRVNSTAHAVLTVKQPGQYRVLLLDAGGERAIWGPQKLGANAVLTLPIEITFTDADRDAPLLLSVINDAGKRVHQIRVYVR